MDLGFLTRLVNGAYLVIPPVSSKKEVLYRRTLPPIIVLYVLYTYYVVIILGVTSSIPFSIIIAYKRLDITCLIVLLREFYSK